MQIKLSKTGVVTNISNGDKGCRVIVVASRLENSYVSRDSDLGFGDRSSNLTITAGEFKFS